MLHSTITPNTYFFCVLTQRWLKVTRPCDSVLLYSFLYVFSILVLNYVSQISYYTFLVNYIFIFKNLCQNDYNWMYFKSKLLLIRHLCNMFLYVLLWRRCGCNVSVCSRSGARRLGDHSFIHRHGIVCSRHPHVMYAVIRQLASSWDTLHVIVWSWRRETHMQRSICV